MSIDCRIDFAVVRRMIFKVSPCRLRVEGLQTPLRPLRRDKALHPDTIFSTYTSVLFEKVAVNMVKVPMCRGKRCIVVAHEDLSGWVEARVLTL